MRRAIGRALGASLLLASACIVRNDIPRETFRIKVDARLEDGSALPTEDQSLCLDLRGDNPACPNGQVFLIDLTAIDSYGQTDTTFNGYVRITTRPGSVESVVDPVNHRANGRNVLLKQGIATGARVHLLGTFGPTRITAEDEGYDPVDVESNAVPKCANGIDDDGDGLIDYPADPGCAAPNDDTEQGGTAAAGVSQIISYQYPDIPAAQGLGPATPFQEEQVVVETRADHGANLIVTRVSSSGMFATDLAYCGDGQTDGAEQCDGPGVTATCESFLGTGSTGTLGCKPDCTFDAAPCSPSNTCGDGAKNGGDQCDGADLGGATCATATGDAKATGALGCTTNCSFNQAACAYTPAKYSPKDYGGLYIFTFAVPPGVRVCDRISYLAGTMSEFHGWTEMGFPSYGIVPWYPEGQAGSPGPCLVPEPIELTAGGVWPVKSKNNPQLEKVESGLVRVKNARIGKLFGPVLATEVPLDPKYVMSDSNPLPQVNPCSLTAGTQVDPNTTQFTFGEDQSACDLDHSGGTNFDTDIKESNCICWCTFDPECVLFDSFEQRGSFRLILETTPKTGLTSDNTILANTDTVATFDPRAYHGQTLPALTGTLSNFSGGDLNWTIEARCADDVIACGIDDAACLASPPQPKPAGEACVKPRIQSDNEAGSN